MSLCGVINEFMRAYIRVYPSRLGVDWRALLPLPRVNLLIHANPGDPSLFRCCCCPDSMTSTSTFQDSDKRWSPKHQVMAMDVITIIGFVNDPGKFIIYPLVILGISR